MCLVSIPGSDQRIQRGSMNLAHSKHFELDFFDFAQTYANFLPIVGVLKRPKKFFLPTLLWGDTAQNVVFGVKIRVQKNGHNFLWLKAFSITLFACYRG